MPRSMIDVHNSRGHVVRTVCSCPLCQAQERQPREGDRVLRAGVAPQPGMPRAPFSLDAGTVSADNGDGTVNVFWDALGPKERIPADRLLVRNEV